MRCSDPTTISSLPWESAEMRFRPQHLITIQPHQNQTIDAPQPDPLSSLTAQHQQLVAQDEDLRLTRGASLKR